MGLVLAVTGIVRTLGTPASQPVVAFELFVSLLVPTGLATGGYWLASRNVSSEVRWRAVIQVSAGIVVTCALVVWLTGYVTFEGGTIRDPLSLTTTLVPVGGAAGFVTAVREQPDIASSGSIDASGASRAADTELPAAAEPSGPAVQSSATTDAAIGPTATVVTPTVAIGPVASDRPTIPDAQTTTAAVDPDATGASGTETTGAGTMATRGSAAVWSDTDLAGRTAAPVCPLQPSTGTVTDDSDPDAFDASIHDAFADGVDSLDSPTPTRDPGVDAVAAVPSMAETVLEVLRKERARLALAVLYHEWNGDARSVDALARAVSYHTDESVDEVAAGLRHATLPELREIRAVDWEPHADRVSASDHAVFEEGVREASVVLESFEPGTR
ncbi:hypothetical protein [Natrinema sp. 1APR25-10V2]|uniref:hypothetical protein n=1 Tax=Natrinema sp. 1APR25-10V2 TaxID=2951081 RepID=UPI002875060D|nr:hypothetical protein [Natrinema sp. 1APR25-10V2]MDS0477772.1 hypothetical protein [Natrinema sp. 1APR25-10V2]